MAAFLYSLVFFSFCAFVSSGGTDDSIGKLVDSAHKMVIDSINKSLTNHFQGGHKVVARSVSTEAPDSAANTTEATNGTATLSGEEGSTQNGSEAGPRSAGSNDTVAASGGNSTQSAEAGAANTLSGQDTAPGNSTVNGTEVTARSAGKEEVTTVTPLSGDAKNETAAANATAAV